MILRRGVKYNKEEVYIRKASLVLLLPMSREKA